MTSQEIAALALERLYVKRAEIDALIDTAKAESGKRPRGRPPKAAGHRHVSLAGRKRIAAAQKKRWAKAKKARR